MCPILRGMEFRVPGRPRAQGSMKSLGRGRMAHSSPHLLPWRTAIAWACREEMNGADLLRGPVSVAVAFTFKRPASHYGTGKNASQLKRDAPEGPIGREGDLDKHCRCVLDAITGVCIVDDRQVTELASVKVYCEGDEEEGVFIQVEEVPSGLTDSLHS